MLPFYQKYWRTAFDISLLVLTVWLVMFTFSYAYNLAPAVFWSLFFYAILLKKPVSFLHRKGWSLNWATGIVGGGIVILLGFSLFLTVDSIVSQSTKLSHMLPHYVQSVQSIVDTQIDHYHQKIESIPPEWVQKAKEQTEKVATWGSKVLSTVLSKTVQGLTSFWSFLAFAGNVLLGLFLACLLCLQMDEVNHVGKYKIPKTFRNAYFFLKENVIKGLSGYMVAQLKIVGITFLFLFIGLIAFRVENAFTLALVSSLMDLLPVVGISTIFLPWIGYLLLKGTYGLAFSLFGLFLMVVIFRQIFEPKIVGDSLGVSAYTMFVSMILSLQWFGMAGLILSPVLIILLKSLSEQGYLKKWIYLPPDEFEERGK